MTPTLTFTCSICGEPSVSICVYCTKDACPNHLCDRCSRCSDCCECDVRLDEHPEHVPLQENAMEHPMQQSVVDGLVTTPAPSVSPEQWAEPEAGHLAEATPATQEVEFVEESSDAPAGELPPPDSPLSEPPTSDPPASEAMLTERPSSEPEGSEHPDPEPSSPEQPDSEPRP